MAFQTTVNVIPTNGDPYAWMSSDFAWTDPDGQKTWDTAYPVSYVLTIEEGWAVRYSWTQRYGLKTLESWRTGELRSHAFTRMIDESWEINEVWSDIWQEFLRVFESWITTDEPVKSMTILQKECCHMAKGSSWASQINKTEGWAIGDTVVQQYQLTRSEGLQFGELAACLVNKSISESCQVTDNRPGWTLVKTFLEVWANCETMTHTWLDFLTFVEGWATNATLGQNTTKPFSEEWETALCASKALTKGVLEAWQIWEVSMSNADFKRCFVEVWQTVDSLSKAQNKAILAVLHLDEAYLRSANAVISDLAFLSGDLTMDQFTSLVSSPVAYGPFTEFIPGEREYQKALIALILAGPLTAGRPKVTDWKLTVDVPDQTDGGTLTIPTQNVFVPFKVRFFAPPEVMIQLRGGSTGTPCITGITEFGFYVQLSDSNGQPIAGDIVWSAVGY